MYHLRFHDPFDGTPDEGKRQFPTIQAAIAVAEEECLRFGFDGVVYVIDDADVIDSDGNKGNKVTGNINPY